MKRIGIATATVVAVLLAVVLVAPSFIDWTEYRATFESRLAAVTGRDVEIGGDVSLALLPRPAFQVSSVRVSNVPGAVTEDFASVESVDVNLAVGPLLSGRLQFTSIELIRPVINAEVLSDGRVNWLFTPASAQDETQIADSEQGASFDLGIDSLIIADGNVNYRDSAANTDYQIEGLNAELGADSIAGPFILSGDASLWDTPWEVEASIGALHDNRPSRVTVSAVSQPSGIAMEFSGQFAVTDALPTGSGQVTIYGDSAALSLGAFALVADVAALPEPLADAYNITTKVSLDQNTFTASGLEVGLGGVNADGEGSLSLADGARFDLALKVGRLDLNSWLSGAVTTPVQYTRVKNIFSVGSAAAQSNTPSTAFEIPQGLRGAVDLRVDLIEWRGQVMRNGRVSASVADAEITLTDAGVDLPGNASVQVTGFIRAESGKPAFDLDGDASSRNLRGFLKWLDVEPSSDLVAPSRLNALSVSSRISGTAERVLFEDLNLTLDTTQLSGTAGYASGVRPRVNLDVAFSNLDLDSYLPALRERFLGGSVETPPLSSNASTAPSAFGQFVSDVDAQAKVAIGSLTAAGTVIRGVTVDAATADDVLTLKTVSAEDFAGARISLSGAVLSPLQNPSLQDVSLNMETRELSRVARALELDLPSSPLFGGAMSVELSLTGPVQTPAVDLSGRLGDMTFTAAGSVSNTAAVPSFDLALSLQHPAYPVLMAGLGYALPEAPTPVAAVTVRSQVKGNGNTFTLSDAAVRAGDNAVSGQVVVDLTKVRPRLSGTIAVAALDLDSLFPPDPTQELARASRTRSSSGSGAVSGRWETEPYDFSAVAAVDATLEVTAAKMLVRTVLVEQLTAPVKLENGVLSINGWRGQVYGGPATGELAVSFAPQLNVTARLDVKNALIDKMTVASAAPSSASGQVSLQGIFSARGASQRDLVQSISGNGAFSASGLDARGAGQGAFVGALLSPVRALSQLGGLLSGGVTKGLASMAAQFTGERGVFVLSSATIKSNVYSGEFGGAIDLPRWWIDVEGRARLEANVLTQLLGNRLQMPSLIPVVVSGPLNAPNVRVDTNSGTAAPPAPTQQAAPSNQSGVSPPSEEPNPVDLFRGILNEITKPQ